MSWDLIQANAVTLPQYEPEIEVGTFEATSHYITLPRGAVDAFGLATTPTSGSSRITRRAVLVEPDDAAMKTAQAALRALNGKNVILFRRFWSDGEIHWIRARCLQSSIAVTTRTIRAQPVDQIYETAQPAWNGHRHGAGRTLDSGYFLDTGYSLDEGTTHTLTGSGTTSIAANNDGDTDQPAIRLAIVAGSSAITGVTVKIDDVTYCDYGVTHAGANVAMGQTLIIDSGLLEVTDTGTDDYAHFDSEFDEWLILSPGAHTMKITLVGGGTGSLATLTYFSAWN